MARSGLLMVRIVVPLAHMAEASCSSPRNQRKTPGLPMLSFDTNWRREVLVAELDADGVLGVLSHSGTPGVARLALQKPSQLGDLRFDDL
jgi:hypothetical protein